MAHRTMLDSRRNIILACALSALAGYVDAIGFLHLGGLFVSFMSGNSTRMGVSLAEGQWLHAAEALGLIALFVVGAAAGSLIVLGRGANRQPWVLLAEALLLAAAARCYGFGLPNAAIAAIVLAMGLENAVFQIRGGAGDEQRHQAERLGRAQPLLLGEADAQPRRVAAHERDIETIEMQETDGIDIARQRAQRTGQCHVAA